MSIIKNKTFWVTLAIFLLSLIVIPMISQKLPKNREYNLVAELLANSQLHKGDVILLTYYDKDKFLKYFNFDNYVVKSISKNNFYNYFNLDRDSVLKSSNQAYQKVLDLNNNNVFNRQFEKNVLADLKPNQKIAIVFLNDVAKYSPVQISMLSKKEDMYKRVPIDILIFSQIRNNILAECYKKLQMLRAERKGSWTVVTFKSKSM